MAHNTYIHTLLCTREGIHLEQKGDFTNLGSWVDESKKDIAVRKVHAWKALNDMDKIRKSSMKPDLKKWFLISTAEAIFLYGYKS